MFTEDGHMQLFRMTIDPADSNRLTDYLDNHYISFGKPGLGDLGELDKAGLAAKLAADPDPDGQGPASRALAYFSFSHGMQDGDYVLVDDGEHVMLGDVGDYYYLADFDNAEDRSGHRRGVTWLQRVDRESAHPELQAFLSGEGALGLFERAVTREELERLLTKPAAVSGSSGLIDEATIREAIDILKAAMRSEDAERRERAAIAILQAARL
jgi:predicted Mrr-cat superfamily restriction endonuclease